ncbi:hypothetical protein U1Q18_027590 [Sarracenia purpurea var. burkii]
MGVLAPLHAIYPPIPSDLPITFGHITSTLSAHIPVDVPVEIPAAEDLTVEDPTVGATSHAAGPSTLAPAQGESSGPTALVAL